MNKRVTPSLQLLIDRMRVGDKVARREFLGYVEGRVHVLARNILNSTWTGLRRVTDSQSLANRTFKRLLRQDQLDTPTLEDFMGYCAWLVDKQLRDIARRKKRRPGDYGHGTDENANALVSEIQHVGPSPLRVLEGAELLEQIQALPEELRDIVHLHGYLGLPQSEVAIMLGLHPKVVSNRWKRAKDILRSARETRTRKMGGGNNRHVS